MTFLLYKDGRLPGNARNILGAGRGARVKEKDHGPPALERAENRTRLMYYDRQEPTTLFNVVPLGRPRCKHLSHPLGPSLPTTGGERAADQLPNMTFAGEGHWTPAGDICGTAFAAFHPLCLAVEGYLREAPERDRWMCSVSLPQLGLRIATGPVRPMLPGFQRQHLHPLLPLSPSATDNTYHRGLPVQFKPGLIITGMNKYYHHERLLLHISCLIKYV